MPVRHPIPSPFSVRGQRSAVLSDAAELRLQYNCIANKCDVPFSSRTFASRHVSENGPFGFLLLDVLPNLFAAARTQRPFCMDAYADIFLEETAFDKVCRDVFIEV